MIDFEEVFASTAAEHNRALGGETVTLSRLRDLRDAGGGNVSQLRLLANASIGATTLTVGPASGKVRGYLPAGLIFASGVTLSAEVTLADAVTSFSVSVVALTAGLTAGVTWTLPVSASWPIADVLPIEPKVATFGFGQGAAFSELDRGFQAPMLSFPVSNLPAGVEPRANDVVTWSRGKSRIMGTSRRLGDTVDVMFEAAP